MTKEQKKNNKGFTLVELIVVLVILAILAAILVPALLGYIDRAKGQQIVLNARSCYTAAQAELSSMYGKGEAPDKITASAHVTSITDTADIPSTCTSLIIGAAELKAGATTTEKHAAYTVSYVAYTENGESIYFFNNAWVEDAPTTTELSAIKTYTIVSK